MRVEHLAEVKIAPLVRRHRSSGERSPGSRERLGIRGSEAASLVPEAAA